MKLLVNPISTSLEQTFSYTLNERCKIAAFYPYILLYNSPAGTFTFELFKGVTLIFSKTFDSSTIKLSIPTTNNYVHAFYPVIPDLPISIERGDYKIKISTSGYTNSTSSFIGWIQQFENIQNNFTYTASDDTQNPLAFRLKIYKEGMQ